MLNEFVIRFRCKKCNKPRTEVFMCNGSIAIMKASLKSPDKCSNCGKSDYEVFGILNVEVEDGYK